MDADPKRESRLKAVRAAADLIGIRPTGRPQVPTAGIPKVQIFAEPPKTKPRQAQGVKGVHKRKPVTDPIKPETIERLYEGGTGVLFATGPGLTQEVVDEVMAARDKQKLYLFGCNDAYRMVPDLDVHYACDFAWWRIHHSRMAGFSPPGGMWTQEPGMSQKQYPGLRRIAGCSKPGLSTEQNRIHFGNNSGYQLINLALLFGIKNFILCGYNMKPVKGERHFFGDHPQGLGRNGSYTGFVTNYQTINPAKYGIEIVNTTPDTALKCFQNMGLTDGLRKFR